VVSNRVKRLEGFAVLTRQTAFSYCVQWRRDSRVSSTFLGRLQPNLVTNSKYDASRKAYRHFFRNFGTLATQSINVAYILYIVHRHRRMHMVPEFRTDLQHRLPCLFWR